MIKAIAERIFKWFCKEEFYLDIRGDLEENYWHHLTRHTKWKAQLLFLLEVMKLMRGSLMKHPNFWLGDHAAMVRNYMVTSFRNFSRHKDYAIVNVIGLTIGMVSLFYILLFVESEIGFDKHHKDVSRIFRLTTETVINGESVEMATTPPGLARRITADLPEVVKAARIVGFLGVDKNIIRVGNRSFAETGGYFADSTLFDVLTYPVLKGNPHTMLAEPQRIVLSKNLAEKYFENSDALGKSLTIVNDYGSSEYLVTGVFDNQINPSHLTPAFICSMGSGSIGKFVANNDRMAGNNFLYTYLKVNEGFNLTSFKDKIPEFIGKHVDQPSHSHGLIAISDIYLHSKAQNEIGNGGDIKYLYLLLTIGALILIIACINFANMSTAQASERCKEIGLRKTFGAHRNMIIFQFLGEASLISLLAMILSVGLIFWLLPWYQNLTGQELTTLQVMSKLYMLLPISLLTGVVAGTYPAFYLSRSNLQRVLGSQRSSTKGSSKLRKVLVTFQFVIGILLIFAAQVTFDQLAYIDAKPLGFDSTGKVIIPLQSQEGLQHLEKVKAAFSNIPGIKGVAGTSYTPAQEVLSDNQYRMAVSGEAEEGVAIRQNDIDFGLIETLNFKMIAGRSFEVERNDGLGQSVILNEAAVRALGMTPTTIVGKRIFTSEEDETIAYRVIGVVQDFHSESLHRPIAPFLFAMREGRGVKSLIVEISSGRQVEALVGLEKEWSKLFPLLPFDYKFLEMELEARYIRDLRFAKIIAFFTVVALLLCMAGIFSLTSFAVQSARKEIGIRKVLGAHTLRIYGFFTGRFLLLVIIAAIIATPLGFLLMGRWLELFAYRTQLNALSIIYPVATVLVGTLAIISHKVLKSAFLNPAATLRTE